jgi:excisionase family DNA binding protein
MPAQHDKILGVSQIARFFGVSEKTVWEWCKSGKLPGFKIGKEWKFRQSDLQKLISQKIRTDRRPEGLF